MTTKNILSPVRMDEETKKLLQKRAADSALSESGYIRMLIRRDAGFYLSADHPSGHAKKTLKDLYRDAGINVKNYDEKKLKDLLVRLEGNDPRYRQFLWERYQEGLTYREIGRRNQLSQERVRQIIIKAVRSLRIYLTPKDPREDEYANLTVREVLSLQKKGKK